MQQTDDVAIATDLGVPRSTALGWLKQSPREVVSTEFLSRDEQVLRDEVLRLRRRLRVVAAVIRLLLALLRVSGYRLDRRRLVKPDERRTLLRAIDCASRALPRRAVLRILRVSASRVSSWRHAEVSCEIDDRPGCPRTASNRLTAGEIKTMKEMTLSCAYRHLPTGTLAILAQRLGKVFASPTTWYRLIRRRGWRRPRRRVHPDKPRVGLRARRPDAAWHVDTTIVKLLDGTKAYVHAVIDNYSRRILAWHLADRLRPGSTLAILLAAIRGAATNEAGPHRRRWRRECQRRGRRADLLRPAPKAPRPHRAPLFEFYDRGLVEAVEAPMASFEFPGQHDDAALPGRLLRPRAQRRAFALGLSRPNARRNVLRSRPERPRPARASQARGQGGASGRQSNPLVSLVSGVGLPGECCRVTAPVTRSRACELRVRWSRAQRHRAGCRVGLRTVTALKSYPTSVQRHQDLVPPDLSTARHFCRSSC